MGSLEQIGEETQGRGFECRDNPFSFVGPVFQDLRYGFTLKNLDVVKSYRASDLYLVVRALALNNSTEFDLVFRAVPGGIEVQPSNGSGTNHGSKLRGKTNAENSVLIGDSNLVESPEDIIPSLVWLERPKDRKQFLWNVFAPSAHIVLEVGDTPTEGEVGIQRILIPACEGSDSETCVVKRGSNLMDSFPGFVDKVIGNFVSKSNLVDFVQGLVRVWLEKHLARAIIQERAH